MLGDCLPIEADELDLPLSDDDMRRLNVQSHWWHDVRNFAGPAVASIGYGFVAVALAEETRGRVVPTDGAFLNDGHNGETAEQFLAWWGDEQMSFYGKKPFQ